MPIADDIRPGDDPLEIAEKLVGRTRTKLMRDLFAFFDIPEELVLHTFGELYARDQLSQKQRELCAVAALCVLGRGNELKSHIIAAIRCGATKTEVAEVLLQVGTYGGMPTTIEGLTIAREVFEKAERSGD